MTMGDLLEQMLAVQRSFQRSLGHNVGWMSTAERVKYIKDMYVATVQELGEALDETSWKPWAKGDASVSDDALFAELIDVWHFVMNLMMVAKPLLTNDELAALIHAKYMEKQGINRQRQAAGYDGKNKCPRCGRAYDDSAIGCELRVDGSFYFCAETGMTYRFES